jgi:trigger factor
MQVSLEVLEGLQRRLTVQLPSKDVDSEVARRLQDLGRRVRLSGFRPGKVPLKVVKRRFGDSVRDEVAQELIEKHFVQAVNQEKLRPAGGPQIHAHRPKEGEDYEFQAIFEVYPELAVQGVESLQVKRPVAEVTESDVEEMLEKLRKQRQSWNSVERPASDGDRVTIDFRGTLEGDSEPFEGGTGEAVPVVIGSGGFIPGFAAQLEGAIAGEERQISVTFPDNYQAERLAGRAAVFAVEVKSVESAQLPDLDDEFAREFGVEEGGLEQLRKELRSNLERELATASRRSLKGRVMQGLLESNQVELPKVLVEGEIRSLAAQSGLLPEGEEGQSAPLADELRERLQEPAQKRVSLGLVVAEIVRINDLRPEPTRVEAELERIAASYQRPDEVKEWYRGNAQAMESLRAMALEEQVVDWVLERCQVVEDPSSFSALTNAGGGA